MYDIERELSICAGGNPASLILVRIRFHTDSLGVETRSEGLIRIRHGDRHHCQYDDLTRKNWETGYCWENVEQERERDDGKQSFDLV